jgi:hypothetical protein
MSRFPVVLVLLLLAAPAASAQSSSELIGGAGYVFSGPSLGTNTPNLMLGGVVRVAPRIGIRADVLYTVDEEEDLVGGNVGGTLSLGRLGSRFDPYLLAGAGSS